LTPGEVRKEIAALGKKYDVSQTKLAKMIGENAGTVSAFMSAGGAFGGSDRCCYRPLANFCEKMRIATGKKKSRKRSLIEAEGDAVPFLGNDPRGKYLCFKGDRLVARRDEIGRPVVRTVVAGG